MSLTRLAILTLTINCLVACKGINPVWDATISLLTNGQPKFQPGFEYLEVDFVNKKAWFALGSRELDGPNTHEYWYGSGREMIHLVNGRMFEAYGFTQEIRATSIDFPSWSELTANRRPFVWLRVRDLMPNYRYGLKEFVISQRVQPNDLEKKLITVDDVIWIEEEIKSKSIDGLDWIYREKFALYQGKVAFSIQCIAKDLCLEMKTLGVVVPQ